MATAHLQTQDHGDGYLTATFRVRPGNEAHELDLGETILLHITRERLAFEVAGFEELGYVVESETAFQVRSAFNL